MPWISFHVPGEPKGKGRPRFAKIGGFVRTYTPEETANYENRVALFFRNAHPGHQPIPRGTPIRLKIVATWTPPASWPKKRMVELEAGAEIGKVSKPDADNLVKVMDALNGLAWDDDSQVWSVSACKKYGKIEGLEVEIAW